MTLRYIRPYECKTNVDEIYLLCLIFFFKVLYGVMWKEGSGYTIGEEDEQIFSYLSRTGVTTKHMKPECELHVLLDTDKIA